VEPGAEVAEGDDALFAAVLAGVFEFSGFSDEAGKALP
jgi:hypothetical protein